jgi:hypothetical protein
MEKKRRRGEKIVNNHFIIGELFMRLREMERCAATASFEDTSRIFIYYMRDRWARRKKIRGFDQN